MGGRHLWRYKCGPTTNDLLALTDIPIALQWILIPRTTQRKFSRMGPCLAILGALNNPPDG